jgi:Rrf2 family protein
MFPQTVELALIAVVQLAGNPSGTSSIQALAFRAKLPASSLALALQPLIRAELIHARRGVGVALAKPAAMITLLDVIDAIKPLKPVPDRKVPAAARLQQAMDTALDHFRSQLASATLADMVSH